jgi:methyl-accepting chemotaxis protein
LDFDDAIKAHTIWKSTLRMYISKPDRSLNPSDVALDHKCQLGQWLHGDGKKFSSMPEFARLMAEHGRFHKAAADVIRKADAGQQVTEEIALGAHSDYASASTACVQALMAMRTKAQA